VEYLTSLPHIETEDQVQQVLAACFTKEEFIQTVDHRKLRKVDRVGSSYATDILEDVLENPDDSNEKGEKNEREARGILRRVGVAEKVDTYANHDAFKFADLIGIKPGYPTKLVQVKTNRFTKKDRDWYSLRASLHLASEYVELEVWVRVDREGWEMYRYDRDKEDFQLFLEIDTCDVSEAGRQYQEKISEERAESEVNDRDE